MSDQCEDCRDREGVLEAMRDARETERRVIGNAVRWIQRLTLEREDARRDRDEVLAERDRARDLAARLEAELAELTELHTVRIDDRDANWELR